MKLMTLNPKLTYPLVFCFGALLCYLLTPTPKNYFDEYDRCDADLANLKNKVEQCELELSDLRRKVRLDR
jgi:hypothetical protein